MNNNLVLPSFKEIFKNSWAFYKANWKTVMLLLLPLEIVLLASYVVLDLIPESESAIAIIGIIVFSVFAFVFTSFGKIVTLAAPYLIERMTLGEKIPKVSFWYLSLIKRIIPISIVLLLVGILNFGFVSMVMIVAGAVFFLVSLLAKLISTHDALVIVLNITLVVALIYVVLKYVISFLVRGMFSMYVYFFENRSGLDALVSSFLITKGREFPIFWRTVGIWFVTSIPFFVLVMPINATIIYNSLSDLYVQVVILHQEPVIASPSMLVQILLDTMTSLAGLLGASLFVVMNYFLWKDIKDTSAAFEEGEYTKTRSNLKRIIGFGAVLFALIFLASLVAALVSF